MRFHPEEYKLYCIQEKKKLLKEWENSGRNTSFCDESIGELIYREYEHRSIYHLFGSREEERKYRKLVEDYEKQTK